MQKQSDKWIARNGVTYCLFATALWLFGFLMFSLVYEGAPPDEANEWGDWAAGMFAPVAFLWIVFGYFQQGRELRNNVRALRLQERALRLQVKELRDSVEQQAALARAAARQAELLAVSNAVNVRAQMFGQQPQFTDFTLVHFSPEQNILTVSATNISKVCYDVRVRNRLPKGEAAITSRMSIWNSNHVERMVVQASKSALHVDVEILYLDALLVEQTQAFRITLSERAADNSLSVRLLKMTSNLPPGEVIEIVESDR